VRHELARLRRDVRDAVRDHLRYLHVSLGSLSIAGGLLLLLVALIVAERVTRATSPAVLSFLTRVFGLLLSAIAVQLVVDGVRSLT
jgi:small neutral amino acid transporter SnatA (MarC family)